MVVLWVLLGILGFSTVFLACLRASSELPKPISWFLVLMLLFSLFVVGHVSHNCCCLCRAPRAPFPLRAHDGRHRRHLPLARGPWGFYCPVSSSSARSRSLSPLRSSRSSGASFAAAPCP